MSSEFLHRWLPGRSLSGRSRALTIVVAVTVAAVGGTVFLAFKQPQGSQVRTADIEFSSQSKRPRGVFYPTAAQWATLTTEMVELRPFRSELVTDGKIAVNEDRTTPIFSPYAGRVTTLLVKPGDIIERGQPLFTVEATDMVVAQNDFIAAATALNKARSALNLAQIIDKRQRALYDGKAVPLKEVQQARVALDAAQNDLRSADTAFEAARNRLRLLGKTDQEIAELEDKRTIDPAMPIHAPISGTIVQRKVGPGQYVGNGASDPVFVVGDLSTVWLIAYVRETEAPNVRVGQAIYFTALAHPGRVYPANISYVAAALDPGTRRLLVRATVSNAHGLFKPEMFASVTIATGEGDTAIAVPRQAIIFEGDAARVWVMRDRATLELRRIRTGLAGASMVEVLSGLQPGEKVITNGGFIDRMAAGI